MAMMETKEWDGYTEKELFETAKEMMVMLYFMSFGGLD
jgi:hypothetical protein